MGMPPCIGAWRLVKVMVWLSYRAWWANELEHEKEQRECLISTIITLLNEKLTLWDLSRVIASKTSVVSTPYSRLIMDARLW